MILENKPYILESVTKNSLEFIGCFLTFMFEYTRQKKKVNMPSSLFLQ